MDMDIEFCYEPTAEYLRERAAYSRALALRRFPTLAVSPR